MKNIIIFLICSYLLLSCAINVDKTTPDNFDPCNIPATYDKFTTEELKWTNYKERDSIGYIDSKKDSIFFLISRVSRQIPIFTIKCKEHYAVAGSVYMKNSFKIHNIKALTIETGKNTSSLGVSPSNTVSFIVSHDNTSNSPIVNWTTAIGCIDFDVKQPSGCPKNTFYPSLLLGGKLYQDVYQFDIAKDDNFIRLKTAYISREKGYIRLEFYDGDFWQRVN